MATKDTDGASKGQLFWGLLPRILAPCLLMGACRVPPPDTNPRYAGMEGEGLVEVLGLEVDGWEKQARDLERRQRFFKRKALRAAERLTQVKKEARLAQRRLMEAQGALAKELSKLGALEKLLSSQAKRAGEVRTALAKIDSDQKRLASLRKKAQTLPKEIAKMEEVVQKLEAQRDTLKAKLAPSKKTATKKPNPNPPSKKK